MNTRRQTQEWVDKGWGWAIAGLSFNPWLIAITGTAAEAAIYGAYTPPQNYPTAQLTWVFLDQPKGNVLGYACETAGRWTHQGLPSVSASDYVVYDIFKRYAIVTNGGEIRLQELLLTWIGYQREFRGQLDYFWVLTPVELTDNAPILPIHLYVTDPVLTDGVPAQWDPQTGWFINNTPVSATGRACVNGGLSAAIQVLEQEYDTTFHFHVNLPDIEEQIDRIQQQYRQSYPAGDD